MTRKDELGRLAGSIETMAGRLDQLVTGQKRFLSDAAHELRSPLARMRVAQELLAQRVAATERCYVEDLEEDLDAMSGLTDQLLALARSEGGWGALAAIIVLGPQLGKYVKGQVKPIAGHSMPLAAIGVLLLWLGWFGFNGGSVLSADPGLVSLVFVTPSLAAAAGIIGAMATSWTFQRKPDLSMVLNGSLAGLVGITAGADVVSVNAAILIGLVAWVIVVGSVLLIDRVKLDDPVGAVSVHLVCGIWGTLAVGIFSADHSLMTQLIGVLAYGVFSFPAALVLCLVLKLTVGLRVSPEEEQLGLDLGEHGMEAYGGSAGRGRTSVHAIVHRRNAAVAVGFACPGPAVAAASVPRPACIIRQRLLRPC